MGAHCSNSCSQKQEEKKQEHVDATSLHLLYSLGNPRTRLRLRMSFCTGYSIPCVVFYIWVCGFSQHGFVMAMALWTSTIYRHIFPFSHGCRSPIFLAIFKVAVSIRFGETFSSLPFFLQWIQLSRHVNLCILVINHNSQWQNNCFLRCADSTFLGEIVSIRLFLRMRVAPRMLSEYTGILIMVYKIISI